MCYQTDRHSSIQSEKGGERRITREISQGYSTNRTNRNRRDEHRRIDCRTI